MRGEEKTTDKGKADTIATDVIFAARKEVQSVSVSEAIERYCTSLVSATRHPARFDDELGRWLRVGASPRGTIALDRVSRAAAWLRAGDHVTPDDVRAVIHDCLRHRLILSYEAHADGVTANDVLNRVLEVVAVA